MRIHEEFYMEYKVIVCKVNDIEKIINQFAKEGWKVSTVTPNVAKLYGVVIVLERDANK